jgi:hypothetical protein
MAGAITGAMVKGKSAGDVEHTEILGVVDIRQHVGHERDIDGHIRAETESTDGPCRRRNR